MKIECGVSVLKEALQNVQRSVASKSTIEVLEGVLIKARSQSEIFICGYNLEIGITTTISAKVEDPSGFVIDPKIIVDILRKTESSEIFIKFNEETLDVEVESGNSKFFIKALSQDEYPVLPNVEDGKNIKVKASVLKKMIKQTIFAASLTDENPISTGTLFNIKENSLTLVCVDGFRLSKTCLNLNVRNTLEENFIVPAKSLSELIRLMPGEKDTILSEDENNRNKGEESKTGENDKSSQNSKNEENTDVIVEFGKNHVIFTYSSYSVISRLLEGTFLDYNAAIPKTCTYNLKINTKELISSIERVSVLISERTKSPVRLKFSNNLINFYCKSPLGASEDRLYVDFNGEAFEIGLNSKYILDALKNADTDIVNLGFSGTLAPVKITPISGNDFLFLVLPVRLVAE